MTTMVCFRSDGVAYCMPVEATRAVRNTQGLTALPAAGPDVAGIIPGDPPLTVIAPLGADGGTILVVEAMHKTFGLLVESVTGLRRIDDTSIRHAPAGQHQPLISGTVDSDGQLVMVTDPDVLAARL